MKRRWLRLRTCFLQVITKFWVSQQIRHRKVRLGCFLISIVWNHSIQKDLGNIFAFLEIVASFQKQVCLFLAKIWSIEKSLESPRQRTRKTSIMWYTLLCIIYIILHIILKKDIKRQRTRKTSILWYTILYISHIMLYWKGPRKSKAKN